MNQSLGNVGKTVLYTDPVDANPINQTESIKSLAADINAGKVDLLVIIGGNPAYDAPSDLEFAKLLKSDKVPLRVHLGLYQDETAELCHWHVNQAHELEAWGDARAYDGTVSIIQPLIAPLYQGKSAVEFVALLSGQSDATGYDLVRAYWQKQHAGADFEAFWRKSLHDGWIEGSAFAEKGFTRMKSLANTIPPDSPRLTNKLHRDQLPPRSLHLRRTILQQRMAAGIAQADDETTWDNAILMGPKMAERLQFKSIDMVELELNGKNITGPVWVQVGHPDNSVTVTLGYGRKKAGAWELRKVSIHIPSVPALLRGSQPVCRFERRARNTYSLRPRATRGWTRPTAIIVRWFAKPAGRISQRTRLRQGQGEEPGPGLTLYKPYPYKEEGYAWGMAIDLNACTGCNACMVACQAENNIAVVGKEQVRRGRQMHWIRVDTHYLPTGSSRSRQSQDIFPAGALHAVRGRAVRIGLPGRRHEPQREGLNDMVYNRCVGTRYCSNNCPYKVRRFNFLLFSDCETPSLKLLRNPDVTVRSRGVMEKCTYCVQRINEPRSTPKKTAVREGRKSKSKMAKSDRLPADLPDRGHHFRQHQRSEQPRFEAEGGRRAITGCWANLNTRPRTTYLARFAIPIRRLKA